MNKCIKNYTYEEIKKYLNDNLEVSVLDINFNLFEPNEVLVDLSDSYGIYPYIKTYDFNKLTLEELKNDIIKFNKDNGYGY